MKKISKMRSSIFVGVLSLPLFAYAQSVNVTQGLGTLGSIVNTFNSRIVTALVTLFATAAMAAFFFGIVQFIWGSREGVAKQIEDGKNFMLWGLIALFVMFSVWGIVQYAQNIFGIQGQSSIVIPAINIQGGDSTLPTGGSGSNSVYSLPSGGASSGTSLPAGSSGASDCARAGGVQDANGTCIVP